MRLPDYPSTEPIISRYLFDSQSKELIYLGSRLNPRELDWSLTKYMNTFSSYGIWAWYWTTTMLSSQTWVVAPTGILGDSVVVCTWLMATGWVPKALVNPCCVVFGITRTLWPGVKIGIVGELAPASVTPLFWWVGIWFELLWASLTDLNQTGFPISWLTNAYSTRTSK